MSRAIIEREMASRIYDVLLEACGASEFWRDNFITCVGEGCTEYRFQGKLGFGGNFRNNDIGVYVDCYREDETPSRLTIIAKANKQLRELLD